MSKKFTQEEYRKIVELHDKQDFSVDGTLDVINYFVHNISRARDIDINRALAIANPITREWSHDQFVEKEKKYYWTSKKQDGNGHFSRLYRSGKMVSGYAITKPKDNIDSDEQLTEFEIKEWGYNPEMFDREEVK